MYEYTIYNIQNKKYYKIGFYIVVSPLKIRSSINIKFEVNNLYFILTFNL